MSKKGAKIKLNAVDLSKNRDKLETTAKKQFVEKTIAFYREGKSTAFVREWLKENKIGSRSITAIDTIISEANALITTDQFSKQQEMIPLHVERYNRQTARLAETKDGDDLPEEERDELDSEKYYKLRERKVRAYTGVLDTMLQKEQLLQYHREDFEININTEEEIEIKQEETYSLPNVKNLSFDEKVELYSLIKKARLSEFELSGVITVQQETTQEVTEDVQHEVVEPANVEKITTIKLPVPPERSKVTVQDPTFALREALKRKAAMKFDKVGNLTEDEKKYLTQK